MVSAKISSQKWYLTIINKVEEEIRPAREESLLQPPPSEIRMGLAPKIDQVTLVLRTPIISAEVVTVTISTQARATEYSEAIQATRVSVIAKELPRTKISTPPDEKMVLKEARIYFCRRAPTIG